MARGKVGDVVFSRLNGEQVSRVRNRHPKNPRTNAQLYQRAIMASVVQMYAAGKEIFDHSFEGKAKGAENQREFIKLNAKKLRAAVAADINNAVAGVLQQGRVVGPGSYQPTPYRFIISRGSYPQNLLSLNADGDTYTLPEATSGQTVAQYAAAHGLIAGDIYTICVVASNDVEVFSLSADADALGTTFGTQFAFVRLIVKPSLETVTDALTTIGQLFNIEASANVNLNVAVEAITTQFTVAAFNILDGSYENGAIGVIRSRLDQDLRSDSEFSYKASAAQWGLASSNILEAWKNATEQVGDSDLILEGGDF